MQENLLIFDSGIGGLSYLDGAFQLGCFDQISYWADFAHFPYGNQQAASLYQTILDTLKQAIEQSKATSLLLACNTAQLLLSEFGYPLWKIPVYGVVYPWELLFSQVKRPLFLSTPISAQLLEKNWSAVERKNFSSQGQDCSSSKALFHPYFLSMKDLAKLVEQRFGQWDTADFFPIYDYIGENIKKYACDSLILSCTHYIHFHEGIQKYFQKLSALQDVQILDTRHVCWQKPIHEANHPLGWQGQKSHFQQDRHDGHRHDGQDRHDGQGRHDGQPIVGQANKKKAVFTQFFWSQNKQNLSKGMPKHLQKIIHNYPFDQVNDPFICEPITTVF